MAMTNAQRQAAFRLRCRGEVFDNLERAARLLGDTERALQGDRLNAADVRGVIAEVQGYIANAMLAVPH